jgi:hypothetical protein
MQETLLFFSCYDKTSITMQNHKIAQNYPTGYFQQTVLCFSCNWLLGKESWLLEFQ